MFGVSTFHKRDLASSGTPLKQGSRCWTLIHQTEALPEYLYTFGILKGFSFVPPTAYCNEEIHLDSLRQSRRAAQGSYIVQMGQHRCRPPCPLSVGKTMPISPYGKMQMALQSWFSKILQGCVVVICTQSYKWHQNKVFPHFYRSLKSARGV